MPKHNTASGLTAKQERFVAEYLTDGNAKRSAEAAGYSARTAVRIGSENLTKPQIKAAIDAGRARVARRLGVKAEDVLREVIRLAMFDPADLIGVKGPDDIAELPEDVRRAIVGWSWDRQGRFTVKLVKEGALEMLAKHFGLYEADNRQKGELHVKKSAADMTDEELLAIANRTRDAAHV